MSSRQELLTSSTSTVDHGDGRLPLTAVVIRDSQEVTVDTSNIMKNDVVKVVAGGRLPVDGVVVQGETRVDESALTGEYGPIRKAVGDTVTGGTVNSRGEGSTILIRAERVGEECTLVQMMKRVEDLQEQNEAGKGKCCPFCVVQ